MFLNVRVNFLVRFASKPLLRWVMRENSWVKFRGSRALCFSEQNSRVQKLNTNSFLTFREPPRISQPKSGISRQNVCFPWFRGTCRSIWTPPHSRGRPPPHRKISKLKILSLCAISCLIFRELSNFETPQTSDKIPETLSKSVRDCL